VVNPGNVHGFWQTKFKSAPNKNSLPTAPMLDLCLGAGHLTGHQCWFIWFDSFLEPNTPEKPDRRDEPERPDAQAPRHAPRDVELSERAFILVLRLVLRLAVTDGLG
jgi:hypothetical protein